VARFAYITLVWFWLGTVVLERPQHVDIAIRLWVISVAATGAAAVVQLWFGDVIPQTSISWGRMTGFTGQVNELGGITAVALVPSLMITAKAKGPNQVLGSLLVVLIAAGLVLSGSLSAMIAGATSGLVWLALISVKARTAVLVAGIGLGTILLLSAPQSAQILSPLQRFDKATGTGADGTFWSRMTINQDAWGTIQRNPLVGVGLDSESSLTEVGAQVHNSLLGVWYEAGILGFAGLGILLAATIAYARRTAVGARTVQEWMVVVTLLCSFLAWIIFGMGNPVVYRRYGWIGAVLILCLSAQQLRGQASGVMARATRARWAAEDRGQLGQPVRLPATTAESPLRHGARGGQLIDEASQ
jgi:O-antigen ligase